MFDVFGPHGAEEEREALWTDLSEIPDEHYSEENPPMDRTDARISIVSCPVSPMESLSGTRSELV